MKKSELRAIIREEIEALTENAKFKVEVTQMASRFSQFAPSKSLEKNSFDNKEDAIIYAKEMIKKYKLKSKKGYWENSKTSTELYTN